MLRMRERERRPRSHPTKGRVPLAALAVVSLGVSGCSIVHKVATAVHDIRGNKATIDGFTSTLSNQPPKFEVKYTTTGSAPATVVYAASPPGDVAFTDTQSGASTPSVDLIVNATGEYACEPPQSGAGPDSCQKFPPADKAQEENIYDFYTASHWVSFLRDFALAAGFAGDKVSRSSMSVNGFSLSCVDFVATGVPGTSTICTTTQGLLGYVKVASDSTSFEITSYSGSPDPSLFTLPPGATVTTVTTTTS